MKVIIAGKNNIAIDVASAISRLYPNFELVAIVNQSDSAIDGFQRSFKKYCQLNNIDIVTLEQAYEYEDAYFFSLEFDKLVKISRFKHTNVFNIHFSMLPAYKGVYTSAWPILNNESTSGVTLHKIDDGIDTGDIIDQKSFCLGVSETAKSLYEKYIAAGTDLVLSNLELVFGGTYKLREQSPIGSSYYSKGSITYGDLRVDLNKTAIQVKRQIDAFSFRDYQLPVVLGRSVFGAKVLSEKSPLLPGKIIEESEAFIVISTIDYDLKIFKDTLDQLITETKNGNLNAVKRLANDFNVNEKNKRGWSPIIVASYNGHLDVVEWLLMNGANINDTNNKGTTVFMYAKNYALKNRKADFLEQLLIFGADQYLRDYAGLNVFDYVESTNISADISFMEQFK